jgi:hypothetical protein
MDLKKLQININNEYGINELFFLWIIVIKKCNSTCIDECDHINIFKDLGEIFNRNEFCVA